MTKVENCEECDKPRLKCPDCDREVATVHDEGIHNTGECGCEEARGLCWRTWNLDVCCPLSPYDPLSRKTREASSGSS